MPSDAIRSMGIRRLAVLVSGFRVASVPSTDRQWRFQVGGFRMLRDAAGSALNGDGSEQALPLVDERAPAAQDVALRGGQRRVRVVVQAALVPLHVAPHVREEHGASVAPAVPWHRRVPVASATGPVYKGRRSGAGRWRFARHALREQAAVGRLQLEPVDRHVRRPAYGELGFIWH